MTVAARATFLVTLAWSTLAAAFGYSGAVDLPKLVAESDAIVRAELVQHECHRYGVYRVNKSYRGPLEQGDEITLSGTIKSLDEHGVVSRADECDKRFDSAVLFLAHAPDGWRFADSVIYEISPSGSPALIKCWGQWCRGNPDDTVEKFETELGPAIARVDNFLETIKIEDLLERALALLSLLSGDDLDWDIQREIARTGDDEALVEALTRSKRPLCTPQVLPLLLRVLADEHRPSQQRADALRVTSTSCTSEIGSVRLREQLLLHIRDRDARVRLVAAGAFAELARGAWPHPPRRSDVAVLERAMAREKDPLAFPGILDALAELGAPWHGPVPMNTSALVVHAKKIERGVVEIEATGADALSNESQLELWNGNGSVASDRECYLDGHRVAPRLWRFSLDPNCPRGNVIAQMSWGHYPGEGIALAPKVGLRLP
jgi:hypothetical protein